MTADSNQQYLFASLPLFLPEALGFSPQLLLDDIINIANNAVQDGVNGMEGFLQNWTDRRIAMSPSSEVDSIQEVEQGLVAFQTLLEYHTDIAFDFFEAWSLRNIFAVPPELGFVLPHHESLDLSLEKGTAEQRERELVDEIEELREKIDNQQVMKRRLTRAIHVSVAQRRRAEQRCENLSSLFSPSLDVLGHVPSNITEFLDVMHSVSAPEPTTVSSVFQGPHPGVGKRVWETSKTGYVNWSVAKLVEKVKRENDFETLRDAAHVVTKVDILKTALNAIHAEEKLVDRC